jgi:hypothetical protein
MNGNRIVGLVQNAVESPGSAIRGLRTEADGLTGIFVDYGRGVANAPLSVTVLP